MNRYLVSAALVCAMTTSAYAERIKEILVVDNSKTSDETVMMLARIEVGDHWKPEMQDQIQRDLVSAGLFKDVDVFTQPVVGGVRVTISAKDKHSWIIAPTFYNQPTNRGAGVGFGENNLFGENKKLLLYGQLATGDSFFLGAYVDPSINATRWNWQWDVFLRRERVFEYAPPDDYIVKSEPKELRRSKLNYLNTGLKAGFNVFKTISLNARIRAAYVFFDNVFLGADAVDVEEVSPNNGGVLRDPGDAGWDVSSELVLKFNGIGNWYGIKDGDKYKFSAERSVSFLGSDFDYWYGEIRWTRARKYFARHNLVSKLELNYGKDIPYQREFTSGGVDLRGFTNRQFRGNVRGALTVEYSVPIVTVKGFAFRAQTFWDSTYTTFVNTGADKTTGFVSTRSKRNYLPGHQRRGLTPFKNTVGIGTRLYVRSIVLPLLGVDVGYGLERGEKEIYFAIGLTGF